MGRTIQDAFPRVIVFDLLQEYSEQDCDYLVDNLAEFTHLLIELMERQERTFRVVYQFDVESDAEEIEEFDQAMRKVFYFGNVMCVIEEIHTYMQREHIPKWLKKMILVGRHRGVGILGTSQRPAEVSKTFVSQCAHVFVGVCFEKNDLKYFEETLGDSASELGAVKPYSFLHYQPGVGARIVRNR